MLFNERYTRFYEFVSIHVDSLKSYNLQQDQALALQDHPVEWKTSSSNMERK